MFAFEACFELVACSPRSPKCCVLSCTAPHLGLRIFVLHDEDCILWTCVMLLCSLICACVRACLRACVRACMRAHVHTCMLQVSKAGLKLPVWLKTAFNSCYLHLPGAWDTAVHCHTWFMQFWVPALGTRECPRASHSQVWTPISNKYCQSCGYLQKLPSAALCFSNMNRQGQKQWW